MAGHLPNATVKIHPDANHRFLFPYPTEFAAEASTSSRSRHGRIGADQAFPITESYT